MAGVRIHLPHLGSWSSERKPAMEIMTCESGRQSPRTLALRAASRSQANSNDWTFLDQVCITAWLEPRAEG